MTLGQTHKKLFKITTGTSKYIVATVIAPYETTQDYVMTLATAGGSVLDTSIYQLQFVPTQTGIYAYIINVYNNSNDLVKENELVCNCGDLYGTFEVEFSSWDEPFASHNTDGTFGQLMNLLIGMLSLYENEGDGTCSYVINAPNGTVLTITPKGDSRPVAVKTVKSANQQVFKLREGLYTVFASNCKSGDFRQDIRVSCSGGGICD